MAFIHDDVFDAGLTAAAASGTRLDILTGDPLGVYAAVTSKTVGNKTVTCTGPANATSGAGGRSIAVPAITSGSVTNNGTATHWALTNASNKVIANGALTTGQVVTSGNTFTLDKVSITIRDAT